MVVLWWRSLVNAFLLISLTSIGNGLVREYDMQTIKKFKLAVGHRHAEVILPSDLLVAQAVHHARRMIRYHEPSSIQLHEEQRASSKHYVTCAHDVYYTDVVNWFTSRNIQYHSSYSSASRRLFCLYTFLMQHHINQLHTEEMFLLDLLEPVPNVMKVDRSLMAWQIHSATKGVSINAAESNQLSAMLQHPILHDLKANKQILLSVMLVAGITRTHQEVLIEECLSTLHHTWRSLLTESSDNFWSYNGRDQMHEMMPAVDRYFQQTEILDEDNDSERDIASVSSLLRHHLTALWSAKNLDDLSNGQRKECSFEQLLVRHYFQQAHIMIPQEWLKDSSSCFFALIQKMQQYPETARVALSRPMHVQNNYARAVVQNGHHNGKYPFTDIGLTGKNVVIGVSDTGIDETSCFFRDATNGMVVRSLDETNTTVMLNQRKIIQYVAFSGSGGDYTGGHGTHVAGTLAGYCAFENEQTTERNDDYDGMAPEAKIAFLDIGVDDKDEDLVVPDDFSEGLFPPARFAGAHVHSNSWGGGYLYDGFCISTDKYLYEQADFLAIFAGGNAGNSGDETVMSPALSKNAIAVACSNTGHQNDAIDAFAPFSSKGPSPDGRIKPDISAPGNYLLSALARAEGSSGHSCNVVRKQGTSMATPVVAGTAALIVQYFEDENFWANSCNHVYRWCRQGNFTPSGSLLKAVILHSGVGMAKYGSHSLLYPPDSYQGYGRMNLQNVIPSNGDYTSMSRNKASKLRGTDSSSDSFELYVDHSYLLELNEVHYSVFVYSSSVPLKVTLSWFDPPNEVFAGRFLLHDLDLVVDDPDGQSFFGNVHSNVGQAVLGASRDEDNTNEQVTINEPKLGEWTVRVQSKRLSEAVRQNYSIVITVNGVIVEPVFNETTNAVASSPLSPYLLEQCQVSGGRPRAEPYVQLLISAWGRITYNGWRATDSYEIVSVGADDTSPAITYSNRLAKLAYDSQEACLPAGCYTTTLHTSSNSRLGTQIDISQCNVFLASMSPVAQFCIDPAVDVGTESGRTAHLFADNACLSSCERTAHILLPLILKEEYEGAGWSGSYYLFFQIPSNGSVQHNNSLTVETNDPFISQTYGAGHMEWGFEMIKMHCLPNRHDCYNIQLSRVADSKLVDPFSYDSDPVPEYPELIFADAFLMLPSDESNMSGYYLTEEPCPYELNSTATAAKVCIGEHGYLTQTNVTFYTQSSLPDNFGQRGTTWEQLVDAHSDDRLFLLGVCGIVALRSEDNQNNDANEEENLPSMIPSETPTDVKISPTISPSKSSPPTLLPTIVPVISTSTPPTFTPSVKTAIPTTLPSNSNSSRDITTIYGANNFSCFEDCPNYPGLQVFANDSYLTCMFFIGIYDICTTFSVAYGHCEIPECAADCSVETWCYFAGGTTVSCPYDGVWSGNGVDSLAIAESCIESMNYNDSVRDNDDITESSSNDKTSHKDNTAERTKVTIAVLVIVIVGVVIGIAAYCISTKQSSCCQSGSILGYQRSATSGDPSLDTSTTIIFNPAHIQEEADIESSTRSSNASQQQQQQDTTVSSMTGTSGISKRLKDGAGFIKEKVLQRRRNKPRTVEYEMVQSPFSITGEDDNDSDYEEDDDDAYDEMEFQDAAEGHHEESNKTTNES